MKLSTAKSILLVVASLFCATILASCGQERFQAAPTKIEDFKGKLVEGGLSSFQEEKGTATLIALTASWCPGCRVELPHLKKLYEEFKDRDFKILMVSEDDSPKIAAKFKKAAGIPWTMFHWNYEMMNVLGNPGVIPVTYLVDSQGNIVKIDVGEFNEEVMRKLIEKLIRK